jgi:hypothetical protein
MVNTMRQSQSYVVAVVLAVAALPACGATVDVRPGAEALAPTVGTVVVLPVAIDWGGAAERARIQRLAGDSLIEVTGGRGVIADELRGTGDADLQAALRTLGEDGSHALTFSVSVGLGRRLVNQANPISTFQARRRLVVDFFAHVDVRHLGAPDVIGTVDVVESGPAGEPEVGPDGEHMGPAAAIDAALARAVSTFAPRLYTPPQRTVIVEVPVDASRNLISKVEALQQIYPELAMADAQLLAESKERFLVVEPGFLAKLGIARGDLLGVPGGTTTASRAALARAVARGRKPLVSVVRGGQRFLLPGGV